MNKISFNNRRDYILIGSTTALGTTGGYLKYAYDKRIIQENLNLERAEMQEFTNNSLKNIDNSIFSKFKNTEKYKNIITTFEQNKKVFNKDFFFKDFLDKQDLLDYTNAKKEFLENLKHDDKNLTTIYSQGLKKIRTKYLAIGSAIGLALGLGIKTINHFVNKDK